MTVPSLVNVVAISSVVEKQAEILIDKYYSCVKVIHKVVLDIY